MHVKRPQRGRQEAEAVQQEVKLQPAGANKRAAQQEAMGHLDGTLKGDSLPRGCGATNATTKRWHDYRQGNNQLGQTRGVSTSRGSSMTRGNAAQANKWQMRGGDSSLLRGGSALRGCKDRRGRWCNQCKQRWQNKDG